MKIAIMQPYLFPYIGYFQLINSVDKFVLYNDVNYIKKGWINRNNFLNGHTSKTLSFSIRKASQNKLIKDLEFAFLEKDKLSFFNFIEQEYKKAPYFKEIEKLLKEIFEFSNMKIDIFIYNSLKLILMYLNIDKKIIYSTDIKKDVNLRGEDKILEICKILKSTEYINAIGGIDLYSKERFKRNNIKLSFLETNNIKYPQNIDGFIDKLSIIDVLMFNSKEKIIGYLNEYKLK